MTEKTRSMKGKGTEGMVCLFPDRVGIFSFVNNTIKLFYPICTVNWPVKIYFSRQGKGTNRTKGMYCYYIINCSFSGIVIKFSVVNCFHLLKHFPSLKRRSTICSLIKKSIQYSQLTSYSLRIIATLRSKRTLAAVSRETPEHTRRNQSQNTFNPGMAEEYINQVSEEIEGSFTKNFFQEFSRTESRILAALSKLDEFLLNHKFRLVP